MFANTTNCPACLFANASQSSKVLRCVYVGRIYSSITKILKFDWSMQVTWKRRAFVNQIHLSKRFSFEQIRWYSKRKLTNTPAVIFLSLLGRWFHKADYYCTIFSYHLQLLAKVLQKSCLKNSAQFAGKYLCLSFFLISQQPAIFLIRDSDLDAFLGVLENCPDSHFYRAPWNSCFCIYGTYLLYNFMWISQSGFSNH